MRKREARRVLDVKLSVLTELVTGEKLTKKQIAAVIVALRGASCAAIALQQRIAEKPDDWPSVERIRQAE